MMNQNLDADRASFKSSLISFRTASGTSFRLFFQRAGFKLALLATIALAANTFFTGCSSPNPHINGEVATNTDNVPTETAVIFATSDIDGYFLPGLYAKSGGIAELQSYYSHERKELGDKVIWLDGGHLLTSPDQQSIVNHTSIAASLGDTNPILTVGKLKVGALSIRRPAPTPNPAKNSSANLDSAISNSENLVSDKEDHLNDSLKKQVIDGAISLRKSGADLVILLTDLPISCRSAHALVKATSLRKPNEPQGFCEGPLARVLKEIPLDTVDAAIVSGQHDDLNHFIFPRYSSDATAGIPVVSSSGRGTTAHLLYLSVRSAVTKNSQTGRLAFDRTRIEGPIEIGTTHTSQTSVKFHGKPAIPDAQLTSLLSSEQDQRNRDLKEILGTFYSKGGPTETDISGASTVASNDLTHEALTVDPTHESSLASFTADAMRVQTHADVALAPLGLFQAGEKQSITTGAFSRADLNQLFPDPYSIVTLSLSESDLHTLVRISENGSRGYSGVSGLQLQILQLGEQPPTTDLIGDHKIQIWEINRLIQVKVGDTEADSSNSSKKSYRVAVPLALIQGGDDWHWAVEKMDLESKITKEPALSVRDVVVSYLKSNPSVNFPAPRLKFVKSTHKAKKLGGRRSRKRRHST